MILKKLAALATRLDQLKLTKEADLADSVLTSLAQMKGLPHDDEDDAEFEDYLSGLESGEYTELEEEEVPPEDEDGDLGVQLAAISKMLSDERLSESEKEMLAGVLQALRSELGDEVAWGTGESIVGEEPGGILPVAEASIKE
jgi:hypothetical protein